MPDVVIVGAGQAGLAASACLARQGIDHVVLEKSGIGASWRNQRWDSFCLVTPNWTVRLPGQIYDGPEPDGFMSGGAFVEFLERYAARHTVPLQQPVEATRASPTDGGWRLETSTGPIDARAVIIATSNYQRPFIPPIADALGPGIISLSAADYRSAAQLPPGRALVVGSAQSGGQIVEDLLIDGREVLLSVSRAGRAPRRYRGRDAIEWQDLIGFLDRPAAALDDPRKRFGGEPHMTGRDGGHTVSLQNFHAQGVRLLGRVAGVDNTALHLVSDLHENMRAADRFSAEFCNDVDSYIAQHDLVAPPDEGETEHAPIASLDRYAEPQRLDLAAEGVSAVVWATGFRFNYSWIDADVFDTFGYSVTRRGETAAPGLYFLGLNYLHSRKSGIIYGVGDDAEHVAERIRDFLDRTAS
ncbi:MAG: SidA/IucD/PvdA family monooxygenase [Alphaproteobacteria bacterium]|nr:SidA/IucD/PvdA family monooxygenase [Alphaproteobacteria bacterium]